MLELKRTGGLGCKVEYFWLQISEDLTKKSLNNRFIMLHNMESDMGGS